MNYAYYGKKFAPALTRWGAAAGSIVFFLSYEDLPAILLETGYGVPCGWRDVGAAVGIMNKPASSE